MGFVHLYRGKFRSKDNPSLFGEAELYKSLGLSAVSVQP